LPITFEKCSLASLKIEAVLIGRRQDPVPEQAQLGLRLVPDNQILSNIAQRESRQQIDDRTCQSGSAATCMFDPCAWRRSGQGVDLRENAQ
jgi:hypothetical protein